MKITLNNLNDVYRSKKCSVETMELKGYELIKELFVDSSGFGMDNEPALTQSQFMNELTTILKEHGTLTAKITGVGQFQVYVGLFKKTGKSKSKRIANNTLEITYEDSRAIRLHDTDILTFKDNKVILDNGGWQSRTTAERMTRYLYPKYQVFQKNWEWYIRDVKNDKNIPYKNGMSLPL